MGSLEKGADLSARLMRLPALGIMRIAGVDARNFLQGQLSNDLRILTPTVSLFAAYNSPQGRVIALLRLIERDREILAILPRDLIGKVIERLRKYVLRAKVLLSNASTEFSVMGMLDLDASSAARHAIPLAELPGAHRIDRTLSSVRLAGAAPRHMLVAPESELITLDRQLSPTLDDEAWRAAAVVTGDPQIYSETSELFVAQMLNLDLIEALSFSKGCYTGQEIITRTQHLGRIKRRMLPFRLTPGAEARRGESVTVSAGRSGRVVEVARNAAGGLDVLAVVPVAPLEAEGSQESPPAAGAISLPLPYPIPGAD